MRALYGTMDHIHQFSKVNAEDYLVQIMGNLIEATRTLPEHFETMLVSIR